MERENSIEIVKKVLLSGEVIEDYADDTPYPTALFLGWADERPFHVVAAYDAQSRYCLVVTAYKPDLEHFENDYKTRRKHD